MMRAFKSLLTLPALLLAIWLMLACGVVGRESPTAIPPKPTATRVPPTAAPSRVPTPTLTLPTELPTLIPLRPDNVSDLTVFQAFKIGDMVRALAFSPDGNTLAAAGGNSGDYDIHIWDVTKGKLVNVLTGHTGIVWDLAFSSDGRYLVSVSSDQTAQIRAWPEGDPVKTIEFKGQIIRARFSPDGKMIAVGGVDVIDANIRRAAVWTYSVGDWEPGLVFPEDINITALAYSPDSRFLIGGGTSRNVQVWSTGDGSEVFTLSHAHQVQNIAISVDGLTAAAATCRTTGDARCLEGEIWLWGLSDGGLIRKLAFFPGVVTGLAYSPEGSFLFAGSADGTLRAYSTRDYAPVFESFNSGGIEALAVSADGRLLATGGSGGDVNLWKVVPPP